jgi:hypothetical protein
MQSWTCDKAKALFIANKNPRKNPRVKYSHEKQKYLNQELNLDYFFAYFFLNLSIRPAVSTSTFCPVKKG